MSKGDKVCIDLVGGPPWGFRLGGGADFGCPLEIAKLRKNSKATNAGLAEGDVVTTIDHQNVSSKSHGDAMKIIELAGPTLHLEIIKGVGPSADLMNVSMMSDSVTTSQSEVVHQQSRTTEVMSQPFIAISKTHSPPRRASTPRTLTIVPSAATHKAEMKTAERPPPTQTDPWTVNVTSYEFANTSDPPKPQPAQPPKPEARPQPPVAPKTQTLRVSQPRAPPPTSPKPKFKANTLPRQSKGSCPIVPSWGAPPTDPALHHVNGSMEAEQVDSGLHTLPKAPPMFKVAKVAAKQKKWQPTSMKDVSFDDPRHKFNGPVKEMAKMSPSNSFMSYEPSSQPSPRHIPAPPPPPPPPPPMSPRKPANHIPGMVNPLICDDSQGDFGANPIVRPNMAGGGTESRKMYSDSAFYDSPLTTYPTIQQQVALAKEISSFLESNDNKRSRGGRMFSKRKQRADEWSMNSQGQRRDIQRITTIDSFSSTAPSVSMQRKEFGYNHVRHHPDPIKSKIDAAELEVIQHNQDFLCKHDELPPNMAFDINQALATSHGKAGQFFEKRKQRAEKYVVDENNRNLMSPPSTTQISSPVRPYKSPWDAAAEGHLDAAFNSPDQPVSHLHQPLNVITNQSVSANSPGTLNVKYKTFKPVTPAYSPAVQPAPALNTPSKRKTRLEMMLEGTSALPASTNHRMSSSLDGSNAFYHQGVAQQQISPALSNQSHSQSAAYSPMTSSNLAARSTFTRSSLRRPKDYLNQKRASGEQNAPVSVF